MTILLLGASSELGRAFIQEFASQNTLLLTGRDCTRLEIIKREAEQAGAKEVRCFEHDLVSGSHALLEAFQGQRIDLLINLASATSNLSDPAIEPEQIEAYTRTDLLTPVELVMALLQAQPSAYNSDKPLRIMFISSVLAMLHSPDRDIYAAYKRLQAAFLQRIAALHPEQVRFTIITIGTRLPRRECTRHHRNIARKAARLYLTHDTIFYGFQGRMLLLLNQICPWLISGMISLSRRSPKNRVF
ncbi:singapore isolate B, sub-type 7 [Candidatus Vecturithrix granuli]|uniref:Singapore isolate B, sub-type 7 n=1 Tax=Vecturithrix granuli TaxID=1499967 RepID=A0A081BXN3_VECG1|nr:singapore isolate B, sub-type 7 [Candidatus Vecturithrix granuli]